jgi:hypothetical protein
MTMRRVLLWIGVVAQLYVLTVVMFYSSNIATIIAIRGYAPLTWDVMREIFIRDAIVSIPIAIACSFIVVYVARRIRRDAERWRGQ